MPCPCVGSARLTRKAALDKVSNERRLELSPRVTLQQVVQKSSGCGSHEPIERVNYVTLEQSATTHKNRGDERFNLDWVFGRDALEGGRI
jgi:hypothetical protein